MGERTANRQREIGRTRPQRPPRFGCVAETAIARCKSDRPRRRTAAAVVVERPAHRRFRRYPPAYAPLPPAALSRAALSIGSAHAPAELASMLCERYTADRATLFASGTQALTAALRAAIAHTREKSVAL